MSYKLIIVTVTVTVALLITLSMSRTPSRSYNEYTYNQDGMAFRARVMEGKLLSLEIEEHGSLVYICQTRAAFNQLNGYDAEWLGSRLFILNTGDIGVIEFQLDDNGRWKVKDVQQIYAEHALD